MDHESKALNEKRKPGFGFLCGAVATERFCYYCMRAILMIFMVRFFYEHLTAAQVWSNFTLFLLLTPVLGALLADLALRNRRSLIGGGILKTMGYIALFVSACMAVPLGNLPVDNTVAKIIFMCGLVALAIGEGLFRPTMWASAGSVFLPRSKQRDGAFVLLALVMNLGAFLGPLMTATVSSSDESSYSLPFLIAAIVMSVSTILIYYFTKKCLGGEQNDINVSDKALTHISDNPQNGLEKSEENTQSLPEPLYKTLLNGRGLIISAVVSIFTGLITYAFSAQIVRSVSIGLGIGLFFLILFNHALQKIDRKKLLFAGVMLLIMIVSEFIHVQASANSPLNIMGLNSPITLYTVLCVVAAVIAFSGIIVFIVKSLGNHIKKSSFSVLGTAIGFVCAEMILYNLSTYLFNVNSIVGTISLVVTYFFSTLVELLLCPITLSIVTRMSPIRTSASIVAVYFVCFALVNIISETYSKITMSGAALLEMSDSVFGGILIFFSIIITVLYFVFKPNLEKTYEKLMEENAS
ncbi:MAG: MFS transporter [Proteobacteria bacterium]|nr:MFS transporter [Pseudomonadota bacterium]